MSTVFVDREKLSSRYIPPKLPHRDQQLRILESIMADVIGEAAAYRVVLLTGPVGTGKTSSVILLHNSLHSRGVDHVFAYMNMKFCGETPFTFFSSFYEKVTNLPASRSLGAGEILRETLKALEREGKPTLLALDEAEHHARSSLRTVIYALTRLHEVGQSLSIVVLFVSRNLEWLKFLDPAERSTIGNLVVRYPPYSAGQLYDILSYRASEAFKVGAISDETLKWLAEYTYLYMYSDVRRALDTLLYAGILAEQESHEKVTKDHLITALKNIEAFIAPAEIERLNIYEKLVLCATLRLTERSSKPYVRISELWDEFNLLLEQFRLRQVNFDEFESTVQKLSDLGALLSEGPARIFASPTLNLELVEATLKPMQRERRGKRFDDRS